MAGNGERKVRFDRFEVNLHTGDLSHGERKVRLPEKPFQALALLIERAGRLVTREELRGRLWRADTFVEFDDNLNATIKRLRQALDDHAGRPRFIETVPHRGYRFIAPVEQLEPKPNNLPENVSISALTGQELGRSPRRLTFGAAIVSVLALTATFGFVRFGKQQSRTAALPKHSLAIVTFANLQGDSQRSFLAQGLTDRVRVWLRQLSPQDLRVIAYQPVGSRNYAPIDRHEMAQLGADYMLDGELQTQGNSTLLVTHLLDVAKDAELWTAVFRLPLQETFVHNDLARRVAESLSLRIPPLDRQELSHAYTADVAADEAYMQGMYSLRTVSGDGAQKSIEWFKLSLKNDPQYALAYAGLAKAYLTLSKAHALPRQEAETPARQAIAVGMRLDSSIPDFYLLQANLLSDQQGSHEQAETAYRRALELDPGDADAHTQYALFLRERRPAPALAEIEKARQLDPLSPWVNACKGWVLISAGRLDDARTQLESALRLDPRLPATMRFLGLLEEKRGRTQEATSWFEKAAIASGRKPFYVYRLGVAYAKAGRESDVRALLAELRNLARSEYVDPEYIRLLQSDLGG